MRLKDVDQRGMEYELLSLISVIFFCGCCHQLIKTLVTPIPLLASERAFARPAMQLGKVYKVMAWGVMTGSFLMGLIFSFKHVFLSL